MQGLCISALLLFAWLVYGFVFSNGLCCADDSYISTAAKNLANGLGYATTYPVTGDAGITPFDPAISTGPTLVLPAAALIRIFGNVPWAPGFTVATASLSLLAGVILILRRVVGTTKALVLTTFFTFLFYCATVPSFAQWYALLGEIPATLLAILGITVVARDPGARRAVFAGCLLLGLALTSKNLALLAAVPVFAYLLGRVWIGGGDRRPRSWVLLIGIAGYLLPAALFELWKLIYFGWSGYVANFRDWLAFFKTFDNGSAATVATRATAYSGTYSFPLSILAGAIAVVGVLLLVGRRTDCAALRCYGLSAAAAFALLGYFMFSAPNNPRYALIGTGLGLFAISCVVCSRARPALAVGVALLCAAPLVIGQTRITEPIAMVAVSGFTPNSRVVNLEQTTGFLVAHQADRPFIGAWWGSVSDLEYMMPTAMNFEFAEHVPVDKSSGRLLVRNRFWSDLVRTPGFAALEAHCTEVLFDAPPYLITRCP